MKLKKIIKPIVLLLIILAVVGVAGIITLKSYRKDRDTLASNLRDEIPGIICIGDSLTNGTGGEGKGYPELLEEALDNDGYIIPVYNLGVGGENTVTIAGRMGVIPMTLEAFIIPEGCEPVEISFNDAYNGWPVTPLRQGSENNNGINPCVVNGIEGTISISQESYSSEEFSYFFTRNNPGALVEVPEATAVETFANKEYRDGIFIVFIGANRGYENIDDLVNQQKAILELQNRNAEKFLIIGIPTGSKSENEELEARMLEEYGDKYINVRELLTTEEILVEAGCELSEADYSDMVEGFVPGVVRSDEIHFNRVGYRILEEAVYERMNQLGYLNDIDVMTDEFNRKWGLVHRIEIALRD